MSNVYDISASMAAREAQRRLSDARVEAGNLRTAARMERQQRRAEDLAGIGELLGGDLRQRDRDWFAGWRTWLLEHGEACLGRGQRELMRRKLFGLRMRAQGKSPPAGWKPRPKPQRKASVELPTWMRDAALLPKRPPGR